MNYATKGAFVQALKDVSYLKDKIHEEEKTLERYEYLRYGKMKSPLDYDVVGYKNKETVRSLKGRSAINSDDIFDRNESLEKNISRCKDNINNYKLLINKAYCDLELINNPLKSILTSRYIKKKKLKEVCKEFDTLYLDESGMYKYIMRELDNYF